MSEQIKKAHTNKSIVIGNIRTYRSIFGHNINHLNEDLEAKNLKELEYIYAGLKLEVSNRYAMAIISSDKNGIRLCEEFRRRTKN